MRIKRILVMLAAALMLCPVSHSAALASETETRILWSRELDVSADIRMIETVFENDSRQAEHYICYNPGGSAVPRIAFGDNICDKLLLPEVMELAEERVLAGINGDYFVMATGMPLGIVVRDGELISTDAGNAAFGFMADGSAILGMPALSVLLQGDTVSCSVNSINKNYREGQFCLYTSAWGDHVPISGEYRCITFIPDAGQKLTPDGELSCSIASVSSLDVPAELSDDMLLLCFSGSNEVWDQAGLADIAPGDCLTLRVTAGDERFKDCVEALGCLYPLIKDGTTLDGLDGIDKNKAPLTAIGIREDGSVILYTADGRQSGYAVGLTLTEAAERLLELGCVEAGALDGGASTVMSCQLPGEEECTVRNTPSLGHLREAPQFLLLVTPNAPAHDLETIDVFCDEKILLTGSSCGFRCGGCDAFGAPVMLKDLRWNADFGSMDNSGTYTAPAFECEATIQARCGNVSGSLRIPVISQPDRISVLREDNGREAGQLRVVPGSVTELKAGAWWSGIPVCAADEQFRWSLEGEIGTVDESGTFTAADRAASGYLCVSCGETSYRLQVLVTDSIVCADDFESADAGEVPGLSWSPEQNRDRVKYGFGSLRLDYDLAGGSVTLPMEQYPTELSDLVSFWLLSDGSGCNVYSVHKDITLLLGSLDHSGWMLFTVDTGQFGRLEALRIGGSGGGSLWLDQLMMYNGRESDTEAPIISLSAEAGCLTARVFDLAEGLLSEDLLRLTVDGREIPFSYEDSSGTLYAELQEAEHSVHVILTAADRSGNYNSSELLVPDGSESSFPDMTDHWAQPYVDHLQSIGILAGRLADDGSTYFDPDARLTRAEFAVMLCRWLRIDLSEYSYGLHFVDENDIPAWAKESVRAAASLGLIHGSASGNGLYFAPQDPLTRAQAAVILGRTLPGGRMKSDLPWPDAEDIPTWSREYVSELAFMGIMKGNGDIFAPNAPITRAEAAKMLSQLT